MYLFLKDFLYFAEISTTVYGAWIILSGAVESMCGHEMDDFEEAVDGARRIVNGVLFILVSQMIISIFRKAFF